MEINKDELIEILIKAVLLGIEALPDGQWYEDCWDECSDEEQEKVKIVREQLFRAVEKYDTYKRKQLLK